MKKSAWLLLVLFALLGSRSEAQEYKTALGIRLSSTVPAVNNSISIKHFLNERAAVEGLLSIGIDDHIALGALYEIHKPFSTPGFQWYYGAGAYAGFSGPSILGAQGVLGVDYKFENIPLNMSLDWKPELNLVTEINAEPAAFGFTIRFVFGQTRRPAAVNEENPL